MHDNAEARIVDADKGGPYQIITSASRAPGRPRASSNNNFPDSLLFIYASLAGRRSPEALWPGFASLS